MKPAKIVFALITDKVLVFTNPRILRLRLRLGSQGCLLIPPSAYPHRTKQGAVRLSSAA
ncbi:MAG TPA: hypothetical protein VGI33_20460 [Paenibacillus sp.]